MIKITIEADPEALGIMLRTWGGTNPTPSIPAAVVAPIPTPVTTRGLSADARVFVPKAVPSAFSAIRNANNYIPCAVAETHAEVVDTTSPHADGNYDLYDDNTLYSDWVKENGIMDKSRDKTEPSDAPWNPSSQHPRPRPTNWYEVRKPMLEAKFGWGNSTYVGTPVAAPAMVAPSRQCADSSVADWFSTGYKHDRVKTRNEDDSNCRGSDIATKDNGNDNMGRRLCSESGIDSRNGNNILDDGTWAELDSHNPTDHLPAGQSSSYYAQKAPDQQSHNNEKIDSWLRGKDDDNMYDDADWWSVLEKQQNVIDINNANEPVGVIGAGAAGWGIGTIGLGFKVRPKFASIAPVTPRNYDKAAALGSRNSYILDVEEQHPHDRHDELTQAMKDHVAIREEKYILAKEHLGPSNRRHTNTIYGDSM